MKELLEERRPGTGNAELAKELQVSEATIRHYLEDRWTSVDRGILERFADLVKCEIGEIFETHPSPFWEAFSEPGSSCHYFRGRHRAQSGVPGMYLDDQALRLVSELIKDCAPHTNVYYGQAETPEQFLTHAEDNMVVVGSPKSSLTSEYALCRIFDVETFCPDAASPPPFQFVWHPAMKVGKSSFGRMATQSDSRCGIWLRDEGVLVTADYIPNLQEFTDKRIKDGRDCAVVVVMNHRTQSGKVRKLVVLSGLTKVGTEAAAQRLVSDFRELEPRNNESYVWGVVEAIFQKEKGRENQKIVHTDWRYRSEGRMPIGFKPTPIQKRGGLRRRATDSGLVSRK